MKNRRITIKMLAAAILLASLLSLQSCAQQPAVSSDDSGVVSFHGRSIDLAPYFEGFPYNGFRPYFAANKLFYYQQGETTRLMQLDLDGDVDLSNGKAVSEIDFSKRNVWGVRYRPANEGLYWIGDERNDEVINLTHFDPATGVAKKLTDVPYIFGWRWDKAQQRVAYVARLGDKEKRLGELRILDLASGQEKAIRQDAPGLRFTWGSPSWRPDGSGVVVPVLKDADRTYGNLVYIDLQSGKWRLLTDLTKKRGFPSIHKDWLSNDSFLYFSNENGFENLYRYDLKNHRSSQLTHFDRDIGSAHMLEIAGNKQLMVVLSSPIDTDLLLIDPASGKELKRQPVPYRVSVLDHEGDQVLAQISSAETRFRIDAIKAGADGFAATPKINLPEGLEEKIVHAKVERVTFPTFDTDPATGKPRMLHGYLYHPKNPLPKEKQLAMIQSFYGGNNSYSLQTQIMSQAGIYVFSPSPRGSFGFGQTLAALNDKDLGGNEIIDVIYAGKFLEERLGLAPQQIGVYGGSHGGYAAMRLLTFPGEINGNKAEFDWGFGLSHAGFSDIIHFYENCNIPDWVTLEAGDPKTEFAKLRDRSPLYHADKMRGKLLLTHGTNDSRVPIAGSRQMADSLRVYGKDFELVEFEDQGHGIKGLANAKRYYQTRLRFLESVRIPAKPNQP